MARDEYFKDNHKNKQSGRTQKLNKIFLFYSPLKVSRAQCKWCVNRHVVGRMAGVSFLLPEASGPQLLPEMPR